METLQKRCCFGAALVAAGLLSESGVNAMRPLEMESKAFKAPEGSKLKLTSLMEEHAENSTLRYAWTEKGVRMLKSADLAEEFHLPRAGDAVDAGQLQVAQDEYDFATADLLKQGVLIQVADGAKPAAALMQVAEHSEDKEAYSPFSIFKKKEKGEEKQGYFSNMFSKKEVPKAATEDEDEEKLGGIYKDLDAYLLYEGPLKDLRVKFNVADPHVLLLNSIKEEKAVELMAMDEGDKAELAGGYYIRCIKEKEKDRIKAIVDALEKIDDNVNYQDTLLKKVAAFLRIKRKYFIVELGFPVYFNNAYYLTGQGKSIEPPKWCIDNSVKHHSTCLKDSDWHRGCDAKLIMTPEKAASFSRKTNHAVELLAKHSLVNYGMYMGQEFYDVNVCSKASPAEQQEPALPRCRVPACFEGFGCVDLGDVQSKPRRGLFEHHCEDNGTPKNTSGHDCIATLQKKTNDEGTELETKLVFSCFSVADYYTQKKAKWTSWFTKGAKDYAKKFVESMDIDIFEQKGRRMMWHERRDFEAAGEMEGFVEMCKSWKESLDKDGTAAATDIGSVLQRADTEDASPTDGAGSASVDDGEEAEGDDEGAEGDSSLLQMQENLPWSKTPQWKTCKKEHCKATKLCKDSGNPLCDMELLCDGYLSELRKQFNIPDVLQVLTETGLTEEMTLASGGGQKKGSGKSGAKFIPGDKYMFKSMSKYDWQAFEGIVDGYQHYMIGQGMDSMIVRFYAVIQDVKGNKWAMFNNWLPLGIKKKYDLKGSTDGRFEKDIRKRHDLKDVNWIEDEERMVLAPDEARSLATALRSDAAFLAHSNFFDYSLIFAQEKLLLPGCNKEGGGDHQCVVPMCLDDNEEKCVDLAHHRTHDKADAGMWKKITAYFCPARGRQPKTGRCIATVNWEEGHLDDGAAQMIVSCMGVIDVLRTWGWGPWWEHLLKIGSKRDVSVQHPEKYAKRFYQSVSRYIVDNKTSVEERKSRKTIVPTDDLCVQWRKLLE